MNESSIDKSLYDIPGGKVPDEYLERQSQYMCETIVENIGSRLKTILRIGKEIGFQKVESILADIYQETITELEVVENMRIIHNGKNTKKD